MATDASLSPHERTGFPDNVRAGAESAIFADIGTKLPALNASTTRTVIDIGCGAGPLTELLVSRCADSRHHLLLVDSPEVLANLPSGAFETIPGRFPDVSGLPVGGADAVIAYSVLQYAFGDVSVFAFVDAALRLLAPSGRLLLGDLPNASMRRRFLASDTGRRFHRAYTGEDMDPQVQWPSLPDGEIDDAVVAALVARARDAGFHAWTMPQAPGLPMANRREDIVMERP